MTSQRSPLENQNFREPAKAHLGLLSAQACVMRMLVTVMVRTSTSMVLMELKMTASMRRVELARVGRC